MNIFENIKKIKWILRVWGLILSNLWRQFLHINRNINIYKLTWVCGVFGQVWFFQIPGGGFFDGPKEETQSSEKR
jgi:hypothetical protein